jgi:hypothetical protein
LGENPARMASGNIPTINREALPKFVCEQFVKDIELPLNLSISNDPIKI